MKPKTISVQDMKAALPDTSSALNLDGLDGTVTVYRDGLGIPHVKASTSHDAFFGQGFATSQDRLWQMEYDRRRAYGRWAEYVGPEGLEQDAMMRRFRLRSSALRDYEALDAGAKAMVDAFAEGVNAFIGSTRSLPVEYAIVGSSPERWEPWDCLAVFKVRHCMMGLFETKLWRARLVNALGAEHAASIVPGQQGRLLMAPAGVEDTTRLATEDALEHLRAGAAAVAQMGMAEAGSNNWAVAGSRTASGKPLLAGDPHRPLDVPNVYYQNHISCPEFDAIGLSFPGVPGFPHFGHNAHVAWCVTHAQADYQDLYVERFEPGCGERYEYRGEWLDAEIEEEVIEVRGVEPVRITVTLTLHGPVIAGDPASGTALTLKYTGTDGPNPTFQCVLAMLGASSVDEINEAMREWVDPSNNFVTADVHGSIAYLNRGRLPVRPMANAWLPVPGWDGLHEWEGFVPFEELVRARDPETGYIVTANNQIASADYPHYISLQFGADHRARRITTRLEEIRGATVRDMAAVHGEIVSIPAMRYRNLLAGVDARDETGREAKRLLQGWDGSMRRDDVAPTIYSVFRLEIEKPVLVDLLGPLADEALNAAGRGAPFHVGQVRAQLATMAAEGDTSYLPDGSDWQSLAADAFSRAVAYLKERLGPDVSAWTWGRVHYTQPRHTLSTAFPELAGKLDPPSVPMSGDGDTPQSGSYSPGDPFTMTGMSAARYVFDLSDWDKSAWITPLGSSGHPASPHYADQVAAWSDVEVAPMPYSWDRIADEAESAQLLRKKA